jgi:hypothetical protein
MMYDDNFGEYNMGDGDADREDVGAFYRQVQRNSIWKTCSICGRRVKLLPHYDKCDSCCRSIEGGYQY